MFVWCRLILLMAALLGGVATLRAESAEERAFGAAVAAFRTGFWDRSEKAFADLQRRFPASTHLPEALLLQAEARFQLGEFSAAVALLSANQALAARWADEYLFWIAQAHFRNDELSAASEAFARLIHDFPNSPRRLEACVNQAGVYARLGRWSRVIEVLRESSSLLADAAKADPANNLVVEGRLLLGEGQWQQRDYPGASVTLQALSSLHLPPALEWRRLHLECQLQLSGRALAQAMSSATNLVALAMVVNRSDWLAESCFLQAQSLERAGDSDGAVAAYQRNLVTNAPVESQRLALLKIAGLNLSQGAAAGAIRTLDQFLKSFSDSTLADLVWLTLGELQLQRAAPTLADNGMSAGGATNVLDQAAQRFEGLLTRFPSSPFTGKAWLDKGWCLWLGGRMGESVQAFRRATEILPVSENQATARFKWADAQVAMQDHAGAVTNYQALVAVYGASAEIRGRLLEPALYQLVRAALAAGNEPAAVEALQHLLEWFPDGFAGDHALLLVGQGRPGLRDPKRARQLFADFERRYPHSSLLPEVRLAVARSYEQDHDWNLAAACYEGWAQAYTNHPGLPRACFSLGWNRFMAGHDTNALDVFTRFVDRFPTNELAGRAQWWLGDFYFGLADFKNAELNYQLVFQKWPASDLAGAARMMAGRSAVARLNYREAVSYFTNLTSDPQNPLYAQALFAYGDSVMNLSAEQTNRQDDLGLAVQIFAVIPATNELAGAAAGRIGDCYLQMAAIEPKYYGIASNAYWQAFSAPHASVAVRSQAKVGLGAAAEKQAQKRASAQPDPLFELALNDYLDVLFGNDLLAGEQPDTFWTRKAGMEAARLVETQQRWPQAIKVYQTLGQIFPPLRGALDRKILRAREQLAAQKN